MSEAENVIVMPLKEAQNLKNTELSKYAWVLNRWAHEPVWENMPKDEVWEIFDKRRVMSPEEFDVKNWRIYKIEVFIEQFQIQCLIDKGDFYYAPELNINFENKEDNVKSEKSVSEKIIDLEKQVAASEYKIRSINLKRVSEIQDLQESYRKQFDWIKLNHPKCYHELTEWTKKNI